MRAKPSNRLDADHIRLYIHSRAVSACVAFKRVVLPPGFLSASGAFLLSGILTSPQCVVMISHMDNTTPTDAQIIALKNEAGAAGDSETVEMCKMALDGDPHALDDVARIISDAQAMID